MVLIVAVAVVLVIEFVLPGTSYAWGPGMHVYVGASALKYIQELVPAVAVILEKNPIYYLYGCLSADIFFGKTGKSTKQKCHTWEIGHKLLEVSKNDQEKAYAYGFLSHLAADTIAHNMCLPYFMSLDSRSRKWQHCFWEWQFDRIIANEYRQLAKRIFRQSFPEVDRNLCLLTNVRFPVFWTKKVLYARTMGGSPRDRKSFSCAIVFAYLSYHHKSIEHLKKSMSLSLISVLDVLKNPGAASCLELDPLGKLC